MFLTLFRTPAGKHASAREALSMRFPEQARTETVANTIAAWRARMAEAAHYLVLSATLDHIYRKKVKRSMRAEHECGAREDRKGLGANEKGKADQGKRSRFAVV
jgi:hypothetical protein